MPAIPIPETLERKQRFLGELLMRGYTARHLAKEVGCSYQFLIAVGAKLASNTRIEQEIAKVFSRPPLADVVMSEIAPPDPPAEAAK